MYEIPILIANANKKHKESWEQTRLISYMIAQVNSRKKLKPEDIIKFQWDEKQKGDTSISNDDIERLKIKAQQYLKK